MKKIIIAFTAIFSMLLYIASPLFIKPLCAFAYYDYSNLNNPLETVLEEYVSENTRPNNFYSIEDITNNMTYGINADTYVLYFNTSNNHSSDPNTKYRHTVSKGLLRLE